MRFVVRINPKTLKQESFAYLEPSPVLRIVDPENPADRGHTHADREALCNR